MQLHRDTRDNYSGASTFPIAWWNVLISTGQSLLFAEKGLPIEPCLFDTFQNVFSGLMQVLLDRNLTQCLLACPATSSFFESAHIKYSIMKMLQDLIVRWSVQKVLVSMNTISSQQSMSMLWYKDFDISQEFASSQFRRYCRIQTCFGQTGIAMSPSTPVVHLI